MAQLDVCPAGRAAARPDEDRPRGAASRSASTTSAASCTRSRIAARTTTARSARATGTPRRASSSARGTARNFDIRTGEALTLPAFEPVETYPVRVEDGSSRSSCPDGDEHGVPSGQPASCQQSTCLARSDTTPQRVGRLWHHSSSADSGVVTHCRAAPVRSGHAGRAGASGHAPPRGGGQPRAGGGLPSARAGACDRAHDRSVPVRARRAPSRAATCSRSAARAATRRSGSRAGVRYLGGRVVSLENDPAKCEARRRNIEEAGLDEWVELVDGDALEVVPDARRGVRHRVHRRREGRLRAAVPARAREGRARARSSSPTTCSPTRRRSARTRVRARQTRRSRASRSRSTAASSSRPSVAVLTAPV